MNGDDVRNPVEEYMKEIMGSDKPDKPPETTAKPADTLEVKGAKESHETGDNKQEAVKVADAIKQSFKFKRSGNYGDQSTPETQIFNIKRHFVGLVYLHVLVVLCFALAFSLISFILPGISDITGLELEVIGPMLGFVMLASLALGVAFLIYASKAYLSNRFILTDGGIFLDFQIGLRARDTIRLGFDDINDITVKQTGPLSKMFDYGTLVIETGRHKKNFSFNYAPNPHLAVKAINDTRLEHSAGNNINYL